MNSLDGIRILDLSRVLAGPWCTQTLADLGADVIKIERPGAGDDTRSWGPPFLKDSEGKDTPEAAYYLGTNRNKRSLTCDISKPGGQALIRELVMHCDVFIENFKVGDMARYGLDYHSLKVLNPRLVYCSVTGFGQTGPYSDRAGYDYAIQGIGGLMSVTGERDDLGGGPQKVGVAVADLFTGMYATVAILAALRHAERTGEGQHVDMALLDTQVAMLANLGSNYLVSGKTPGRAGNAHQNIVPYQVFEVKAPAQAEAGSRDHLILAVGNDGQYAVNSFLSHVVGCSLDELHGNPNGWRPHERVDEEDCCPWSFVRILIYRRICFYEDDVDCQCNSHHHNSAGVDSVCGTKNVRRKDPPEAVALFGVRNGRCSDSCARCSINQWREAFRRSDGRGQCCLVDGIFCLGETDANGRRALVVIFGCSFYLGISCHTSVWFDHQ